MVTQVLDEVHDILSAHIHPVFVALTVALMGQAMHAVPLLKFELVLQTQVLLVVQLYPGYVQMHKLPLAYEPLTHIAHVKPLK